MMTSFPVVPPGSVPSSTTCTDRGICHQKSPVAHAAAASVRTIGVPTAPSAPYILECESDATTKDPGTTYPRRDIWRTLRWLGTCEDSNLPCSECRDRAQTPTAGDCESSSLRCSEISSSPPKYCRAS